MTGQSLDSIAKALGAECVGDGTIVVNGLAEPANAASDQLAVAMDDRYLDQLRHGAARCAIVSATGNWEGFGLDAAIVIRRPRHAMAGLTSQFAKWSSHTGGYHETALIGEDCDFGDNVAIGPYSVIADNVRLGENCVVGSNSTIGEGVTVGKNSVIGPGVHIASNVEIGDDCIFHAGTVVGSDGFSFVTEDVSNAEMVKETLNDAQTTKDQSWLKIHSLGGVLIGDNVEIGANSSVDAGTIRPTEIGDGTKLDSLVQVGHNVRVGRNCLLCAHVAVGGSAVLGDNVVLGGQVGIADNIKVGNGVVAGGASKVLSNVPSGRAILGYPAVKMETHVETYKILRRLPQTLKQLKKLQDTFKSKE